MGLKPVRRGEKIGGKGPGRGPRRRRIGEMGRGAFFALPSLLEEEGRRWASGEKKSYWGDIGIKDEDSITSLNQFPEEGDRLEGKNGIVKQPGSSLKRDAKGGFTTDEWRTPSEKGGRNAKTARASIRKMYTFLRKGKKPSSGRRTFNTGGRIHTGALAGIRQVSFFQPGQVHETQSTGKKKGAPLGNCYPLIGEAGGKAQVRR